ncbi:MAG: hypothetical protein IT561_03585 [Alphaproteobacteria bacterium]|nr:hypothetical protein [Alphaproteobacteria bacterium]
MARGVHLVAGTAGVAPVRRLAAAGPAPWLRVHTYGETAKMDAAAFPPGAWVFTDLDRLDDDAAFTAMQFHDRLGARGDIVCVNHPTRTLRRFELLRLLRNMGRNVVDVFRVEDRRAPSRWPVAVRTESDPLRERPRLLRSAAELDAELDRLEGLDAYRPDLLVVELPGAEDRLGPATRLLRIGDVILVDAGAAGAPRPSAAELEAARETLDLARVGFGSVTLCRLGRTLAIVDAGTDAATVTAPSLQPAILAALGRLGPPEAAA